MYKRFVMLSAKKSTTSESSSRRKKNVSSEPVTQELNNAQPKIDAKLTKRQNKKMTSVESTTVTKSKKPKTSKIITKQHISSNPQTQLLTNIILNLKCSMLDLKEYNEKLSKMISNPLEYNSSAPPEVKYYDGEPKFGTFIKNCAEDECQQTENQISMQEDCRRKTTFNENIVENASTSKIKSTETSESHQHKDGFNYNKSENAPAAIIVNASKMDELYSASDEFDDINVKEMSSKIKQLKIQLYKNSLNSEKKSACFWCTYDFDNCPCYIPKYEMDGTIYGYGSFCRPECAVAYLMKETIDDSTKFDRYHLLNQIYSKVYDCKKNIKPAPDPHYLLDKFYGNLNIQEYRRLLKTEHLLLVVDKPLTRILPELHEDTDDAFTKIYGIKTTSGNSSGVYKVKRQSEQPNGPSKASIVKTTFGI